jgi:thiol-disulfide isomerase/thioredoxin
MPSRRASLALAAALVAGAGLLGGCGAQSSSAGEKVDVNEQGYVSGDGSTTIVPTTERRAAPELTGPTLSGAQFDLSEHRGTVVVLNVWASWCAPCRAEAADLAAVDRELDDDQVLFVGLNTRDSDAAAKAFVERFEVGYDSVVDAKGSRQLLFRDTLPPAAIPSTLVIDADGRVAARAIGEVDRSRLLGLIEPILAESAQPSAAS